MSEQKKKIWGWFFFDWASQPYNTLLLTFIFAPYIKELIGDGAEAQSVWGLTIGAAGIVIAILAPILGSIADTYGNRMRWIWFFSICYVIGSFGIWYSDPDDFNLLYLMVVFSIGLFGMEFATIFTNSILPDLGPKEEIGRISGKGWAFGYIGGLITLIIMLLFFAESADTGKTFVGMSPPFGLDAEAREGTRFVGPLTGIWFILSMIPFFLWVRDPRPQKPESGALKKALRELGSTIKHLPQTPSLFAYLGSSMFYRDALNGIYVFGGIYAAGVLEWSVVDTGIFGILAIISGAIFAYVGGYADDRFGPKKVITFGIIMLTIAAIVVIFITRDSVFGIALPEGSAIPDILFYIVGFVIGAGGGFLQSASRTMMVRQAKEGHMAEAFGLYGMAGKATAFVAPTSIGILTAMSDSQQIGLIPIVVLFALGLFFLRWVKPEGDHAA